jgi:hypothetical protein
MYLGTIANTREAHDETNSKIDAGSTYESLYNSENVIIQSARVSQMKTVKIFLNLIH